MLSRYQNRYTIYYKPSTAIENMALLVTLLLELLFPVQLVVFATELKLHLQTAFMQGLLRRLYGCSGVGLKSIPCIALKHNFRNRYCNTIRN